MRSSASEKVEKMYLEKTGESLAFGRILDKFSNKSEKLGPIKIRMEEYFGIELSKSALYESVKKAINNGETEYRIFAAPPRDYTKKRKEYQKINNFFLAHVTYHCKQCGGEITERTNIDAGRGKEIVGLTSYVCPRCYSIGECDAEYISKIRNLKMVSTVKPSPIRGMMIECSEGVGNGR